jgi:reverse transcriptase-like protein
MGAILSQAAGPNPLTDNPDINLPHKNSKPKLHPIAYYSATFTPTERNYDIYE